MVKVLGRAQPDTSPNLLMTKGKDNPRFKHGLSTTRSYTVWRNMLKRCLNPKDGDYPRYGGRGIKICKRWLRDYRNFYKDMGERPEGLSLDRKNNDRDYKPSNCRWATPKEQAVNRKWPRKRTGQLHWNQGKKLSEATKQKISLATMGRIPWNKGARNGKE